MWNSKRDTDVKNSLLDSVGEGEGGMIWEKECILSYVKQTATPGSMHETGCSGLVHWDDPEGWDVVAVHGSLIVMISLVVEQML